jgi:hypothetical protein
MQVLLLVFAEPSLHEWVPNSRHAKPRLTKRDLHPLEEKGGINLPSDVVPAPDLVRETATLAHVPELKSAPFTAEPQSPKEFPL